MTSNTPQDRFCDEIAKISKLKSLLEIAQNEERATSQIRTLLSDAEIEVNNNDVFDKLVDYVRSLMKEAMDPTFYSIQEEVKQIDHVISHLRQSGGLAVYLSAVTCSSKTKIELPEPPIPLPKKVQYEQRGFPDSPANGIMYSIDGTGELPLSKYG